MVTRRAVLKGTAAASIGAIAAAHGATPVEAQCGYGNLEGGALAAFYKEQNAFQVSLKFHKAAADIFIKYMGTDGVAIFAKFFHKHWEAAPPRQLDARLFPDLKLTELNFVKIDFQSAGIFMKNQQGNVLEGEINFAADKLFQKWREVEFSPDTGQIGDVSGGGVLIDGIKQG